jgi:class 3 adenylate cyclase
MWGVLLSVPLLGLALLLAVPELDVRWQHQPSHFWLVLGVAVLNVVLGLATSEAASRRGDARTFLVSMALLISAGFLGLHALATPGVLLDAPNAGFAIATPIGLTLASAMSAASADERIVALVEQRRAQQMIRAMLLLALAAWAVASLTRVPLLDRTPTEELPIALRGLAPVAIGLYAYGATRYAALYRRRRRVLPLAVAIAWILLAEAMVAIVFARSWHASWWEWHLLMAAAFGAIFLAARAEYRREGSVVGAFSGLYLEQTLALVDRQSSEALTALTRAMRGEEPLAQVRARLRRSGLTGERIDALERSAAHLQRVDDLLHSYVGPQLADELEREPAAARLGGRPVELSVMFADLVGFTSFSEERAPEAAMELLNTYWEAVVPTIVEQFGGFIERFAGDGILVLFNTLGDQPDHALRAARAAVFMQRETGRIAAQRPGWPRFRIGINTGSAVVGNVGADQQRSFTVIGDTANTAARLEAFARPGHIAVAASTYRALGPSASATPVGPVELKGKAQPVEVYDLHDA